MKSKGAKKCIGKKLLLNGLAGFGPRPEAAGKVIEIGEIKMVELVTRSGATHAAGAMHQINFAPVEQGGFCLKVGRTNIEVHRSRNIDRKSVSEAQSVGH